MADKVVAVPGLGNVAFPDTMSDDDIAAQIKKSMPSGQATAGGPAPAQSGKQEPEGFWHSLYSSTVGGAMDTLKTAVGTEGLSAIADQVKQGNYKNAALLLGHHLAEGPAGRLGNQAVQSSVDSGKKYVQDLKDASAGKDINLLDAGAHAVGMVPAVGPIVSKPLHQVATGDYTGALGTALGTAGMAALPGAAEKTAAAVDPVMDSAAQGLTKSALKGGYTVNTPAEDVSSAVSTMRENRVPLTPAGQAKIEGALADVRQQIEAKVNNAAANGAKIDPRKVASRLDDTRSRFETQVNPTQDLKDIDKVRQNFMDQHTVTKPGQPGSPAVVGMTGNTLQAGTPATPPTTKVVPIPVDEAQAIKVGSNTLNADKYGKVSTAQVEAEKALTRGIKEELEAQIPELKGLNQSQAKLMNLDDILGKAVNKYTNSAGFVGDLSHTGIAASALRSVLANPVLKARLATAIDTARRLNPGKYIAPSGSGAATVNSLIASLAPQQSQQQQQ